jgi:DnaJ-class molecular chaperone
MKPKERNKQPDFVRKAGPHDKPERYEPEVCYICGGTGETLTSGYGLDTETCYNCQGTGEV